MKEQIIESIDHVFEEQNARIDDMINNFTMNKVDDNCEIIVGVENGKETDQLNENKDNKVSRGEKNDNIIKNMVLESKVVNIESADEVIVGVEFDNEVIESVDELERKCRESLQVEGLQRVKFSRGVVVVGEENASRVYLGDVWSTNNCPLIFCAPGGARWCSNKVVLPSAGVSRESVIGHYGERYFERELCVEDVYKRQDLKQY